MLLYNSVKLKNYEATETEIPFSSLQGTDKVVIQTTLTEQLQQCTKSP